MKKCHFCLDAERALRVYEDKNHIRHLLCAECASTHRREWGLRPVAWSQKIRKPLTR
jgi:hypothetical protein